MYGVLLALAVAVVAAVLGHAVPIVGAPVFAIVLGALIATVRPPAPALRPGIKFASKQLLQWSIVLLGAHLSLREIVHGGAQSLPVMLGTLVVVLVLAYFVGGALGLDRDIRRLVGIGTAICGGSAIAAVASVIEADQADIAYSLGVVFLFNVVAVVVFPALGHLMALTQHAFGLWAGTAINDTSSVVAAAFAYGHDAGNDAVIVKLTRTTLIVPIVLFYGWRRLRYAGGERGIHWREIVPWFIVWFLIAAALNSLGLIPAIAQSPLQELALFAIAVALAGVGLGTEMEKIRAAGLRPLALGAILWAAIALSSLAIAHVAHIAP
ncbi:MAG TPA: putative sulfate exporter family transporter [Candidatus Acidoferrales bacterium]|nr:putative sulfate exporter family transporter [Candidatus Acidoferrales bacterium]